ncbi:hypothetical protein PRNP1_010909 [Phytophthora ramorum]
MLTLAETMLLKTLRETGRKVAAIDEGQETVKLSSAAEARTTYEIELGPTQAMDNLPLKATVAEIVANWTRCGAVNRKVMKKFDTEMTGTLNTRPRQLLSNKLTTAVAPNLRHNSADCYTDSNDSDDDNDGEWGIVHVPQNEERPRPRIDHLQLSTTQGGIQTTPLLSVTVLLHAPRL